jgi:hypothetical protein
MCLQKSHKCLGDLFNPKSSFDPFNVIKYNFFLLTQGIKLFNYVLYKMQ